MTLRGLRRLGWRSATWTLLRLMVQLQELIATADPGELSVAGCTTIRLVVASFPHSVLGPVRAPFPRGAVSSCSRGYLISLLNSY